LNINPLSPLDIRRGSVEEITEGNRAISLGQAKETLNLSTFKSMNLPTFFLTSKIAFDNLLTGRPV